MDVHVHTAIDVDTTAALSNPASVGRGRQGLVFGALAVALVVTGALFAATAPRERPLTDVPLLRDFADRSVIAKSD